MQFTTVSRNQYPDASSAELEIEVKLPREAWGLCQFEIVGVIAGKKARALWDGQILRMTTAMHSAATLSMSVEAVFASAPGRTRAPSFADNPMDVAVELVRCVDVAHVIDYSTACPGGTTRRRWSQEGSLTMPNTHGD